MQTADSENTKLWAMIKGFRFAMLTTREPGGALRARPMTTIDVAFDGSLWFFAQQDSDAARAIREFPQVCLSYGNDRAADFVCVSGAAEVVTDVNKKKQLWNPAVEAWFPQGAASPNVVLFKVSAEHAEYWDSNSSKLVRLFSMATALATGKPPQNMGEHRDVPLAQHR
jgi:general stress protein 26